MTIRPFRVLLIDDTSAYAWRDYDPDKGVPGTTNSAHGALLRDLLSISNENHERLELFLSANVGIFAGSMKALSRGARVPDVRTEAEAEQFLASIDVLVLDIGGVGTTRGKWCATAEHVPGASASELEALNGPYGGAGFYLYQRHNALRGSQAVIILTQYDSKDVPVLQKYLDPLCSPDAEPWTIKHALSSQELSSVRDLIASLFDDFNGGYVQLHSRGAIEFAASHDLPVLIVGESGTGKEYIANAIHRRWVQEKKRAKKKVREQMVVVHCGALLPTLARSELFGHVRGSFTGADDHQIGALLEACSIKVTSPERDKYSSEQRKKLEHYSKQVAEISKVLDEYEQKLHTDPAKAARYAQTHVIERLTTMMAAQDGLTGLIAFLPQLRETLDDAMRPRSFATEFQVQMMKNPGLTASGFDMTMPGGPFGTIFLDEFGDLPSDVQALLMRYLQSYEVQPIGYPGRILGARVRIIAATSDPAVASSIGLTIDEPPRFHSSASYGSIRNDLLSRVAAQRIRAQGVSLDNTDDDVQSVVATKSKTPWKLEAVHELAEWVKGRLSAVRAARHAASHEPMPVFGHWRELVTLVSLVDEFVHTARDRGIRSVGDTVDADIVRRVASEMPLAAGQVRPSASVRPAKTVAGGSSPWKLEEFATRLGIKSDTKQAVIISRLTTSLDKRLTFEDFKDIYRQEDEKKARGSFQSAINRLKDTLARENCGWEIDNRQAGYILRQQG